MKAQCPTYLSLVADLASGMTQEEVVSKAAQQLADWIDERCAEEVYREVRLHSTDRLPHTENVTDTHK